MSNAASARDQLEKILASSVFASSPRMRRFLEFVVEETLEGRASQIKEYAIAIEVFGKRPDFDPHNDSTVRTEATKLRARLDRYYSTEGVSDTLVISLPKGAYVPVFREVDAPPPPAPSFGDAAATVPTAGRPPTNPLWRVFAIFAISVSILVIVAGVWVYWWGKRERRLVQLDAKASVLMDSLYEDKWSGDAIVRSIDYYRRVVSVDPKSASGYAGIALGYVLLSDLYMAPREAMPKAALAATRAMELDRRLGHVSLGLVKLQFEWDWPSAENELKSAIALSPRDSVPHILYGVYLMAKGRFEESRAELERVIALDPSDEFGLWELGLCHYFSRRYEEAAEQERRAIALQPKDYWPHMILGWTLEQQGKFDDAISEITIATRLTDFPQVIAALAHAQAMAGRRNEADRLLQDLFELSKRRYVSPYDVATVYAANSDTENTLTFLEKACDGRSGWLPLWMSVDPKLDRIRGQERFSAILKRVGIPDSQPQIQILTHSPSR